MFDRLGVGSPSPFGVRSGILAVGVHAAILSYGLRAPRHADPAGPASVDTMVFFPQPQRSGVTGTAPIILVPGPVDLRGIPVTIPTIPGGPLEAGPIAIPAGPFGAVPSADPNGVYDSNVVEQPPELLSSPPPRYPELLRQARVEGAVIVEGVVDTVGHLEPSTLRVLASPHPALSASAGECLLNAVFRPGRVEGRAVRVLVQVPVRFSIARP